MPRVVAYQASRDYRSLVKTALTGQPMDPGFTRRERARCCAAVTKWLLEVQDTRRERKQAEGAWFERLVQRPIDYFSKRFPVSAKETQIGANTGIGGAAALHATAAGL